MEELTTKIVYYVTMYAPVVLTFIGTLLNWTTTIKKLKDINVKEDIQTALTNTNEEIKEVLHHNRMLLQENEKLRSKINELLTHISKVEHND